MFLDIAPSEFLVVAVVAVVAIGPKDLPRAMRMAGQWMGKMRRMSNHFRSGIDNMIREAELADMEKKWREQNEAIMQAHPPAYEGAAHETPALPHDVVAHAPTEPLAHDHVVAEPVKGVGEGHDVAPTARPEHLS